MPRFQDRLVVAGHQLFQGARAFVAASGRQHMIVRNDQGHVLFDVPFSLAVALALMLPRYAAIAAMAALASGFSLIVAPAAPPVAHATA